MFILLYQQQSILMLIFSYCFLFYLDIEHFPEQLKVLHLIIFCLSYFIMLSLWCPSRWNLLWLNWDLHINSFVLSKRSKIFSLSMVNIPLFFVICLHFILSFFVLIMHIFIKLIVFIIFF